MEEQEYDDKKVEGIINFNNLPKDITFDIFSRISLKNLCQLRCVCKKWLHYLCLNQEFRVFYHQKHKINPLLLFTQQIIENEISSTKLSSCYIDGSHLSQISTNIDQNFISIQTCNGILCLITKTNAKLYDPITKQLSNLPNSAHFSSTISFSFGFLNFSKVFKLLHFYTINRFDNFHYCQMQEVMCEIVSTHVSGLGFESHQVWKVLGKCPYDNVLCRKNYAHVDGKFYWLIGEKKFNPHGINIMSFNLESESFGMIYFPILNRSVECLDLVEINGRLCLTDRLPWESCMDVWMMVNEDHGFIDKWDKKYRIDLKGIHHHDVRILGHFGKNTRITRYGLVKMGSNKSGGDDLVTNQYGLVKVGSDKSKGSDLITNQYGLVEVEYDKSNGSSDICESVGEILVKFGEESFGFYELHSGVYRDLASEINMQEKGLQFMVNRKYLL